MLQERKKDPIKWRILSIKGTEAFLIADQNLDVMQYNRAYKAVTWENCRIRSWLNGYGSESNGGRIDYSSNNFIDKAFNKAEQAAILTTDVVNDDNREYGTVGGTDTQDKIFLLSIDEVSNSGYGFLPYEDADTDYIKDPARQRTNTNYVNNGGTIQSEGMKESAKDYVEKNGGYWWWLRSPGEESYRATGVHGSGYVHRNGAEVYSNSNAICPALHLDLSSSSVWSVAESVTVER